ncbi:MAG: cytochrome c family protein, partial [Desulfobulbaceae bacterium]|nr:cytochrome c family protein [Desulfobulbaceae bacterium]
LSKQFLGAGKADGPNSKAFQSFSPLFSRIVFFVIFLLSLPFLSPFALILSVAQASPVPAIYVGSDACKDCHADEYDSFVTYAKKSKSFESIEKLRRGLLPEDIERCYSCHTTGYGQPGGFVSSEQTPQLKNAGCEVCHGPGSIHVLSRSSTDIKRHLTTDVCGQCHISERVKAFRYKPMIHGGAH